MALPKGKISKARKHSRRANWKLTVPGIVECPQCHQMKLAHRVCKHCGFYKGVQVVAVTTMRPAIRSTSTTESDTSVFRCGSAPILKSPFLR